jgi:nucleotide-binding universal stress UspA family protein
MEFLLAIERSVQCEATIDFTIGLATTSTSTVHVLHIRELSNSLRVPPLESKAEADELVSETADRLEAAGVAVSGEAISARETEVARQIVDAARWHQCDAIILGSHRLRGIQSILGHGTRERILKMSPLPVILAPPTLRVDARTMADL